jgi:hypothetical protein
METKTYFLQLLSAYINNELPPIPNDTVNWAELLKLSKIHSVQAMIFMAIDKLTEKPPIYAELKKDFIISVNVSTMQEIWMEKLIDALHKNNIDHTLMKGYVLRNYYPNKEARTFGDIDFLINNEDREKSHTVIQSVGFEYDNDAYSRDVWTYHKGIVNLEVHTDIIYEDLFNDIDFRAYFREKIKNKQLISGNTYELKREDHFIYILVHLAKHFYNAGIGIRMCMDVAVFINKYGKQLDFNYINNEMTALKLDEFLNTIYFICSKYFNTEINCIPIRQENEYLIMEYILNHGVFGFNDKDMESVKYHKKEQTTSKIFLSTFFPSYEIMQKQYDWFTNKPKYLLPYAWIRRLLLQITNTKKRNSISRKFNAAIRKNSDADIHNKMLYITGIKKQSFK